MEHKEVRLEKSGREQTWAPCSCNEKARFDSTNELPKSIVTLCPYLIQLFDEALMTFGWYKLLGKGDLETCVLELSLV